MSHLKHIAIFASGTGSNARKMMEYFANHPHIRVSLVVSNKAEAPVLATAATWGIPTLVIDRNSFYHTQEILGQLRGYDISFVVLAGFLWLIPAYLVNAFPRKIVNIHPALLPKYGGKGMYGAFVHEAVKAAGERQSGITIHYVNERYDEGDIIFQTTCDLSPEDSPKDIAHKVQLLEHAHFASVVESIVC